MSVLPPAGAASELFPRLIGPAFERLPELVRRLHTSPLPLRVSGEAQVHAATRGVARLLARLLGFPSQARQAPISVLLERDGRGERWSRCFAERTLSSRLQPEGDLLMERFGPLRLRFQLEVDGGVLHWRPRALSLLGLPLPRALAAAIEAREWVEDGRYRFLARGALPGVGQVVGYEGWLEVARARSG